MRKKRLTEQELLKDLDACKAHADELADLLPHESDPQDWGTWFDDQQGVSEDFMEHRDQSNPQIR